MGKKLEIKRNFYDDYMPIFNRKNIVIEKGITVLVGCNGSGKTTLILQLKELVRKEHQCIIEFNNLIDGGRNMRQLALDLGDFRRLVDLNISSEGENIYHNMCGLFGNMRNQIKKKEIINNLGHKFKEIWLFLDAVDSGLDIIGIIDLKRALNTMYLDLTEKGYDVYTIISANTYELARESNCFDVKVGKYITFTDYESYRKFVIDSNKKKQKRYNDSNIKLEKENRRSNI